MSSCLGTSQCRVTEPMSWTMTATWRARWSLTVPAIRKPASAPISRPAVALRRSSTRQRRRHALHLQKTARQSNLAQIAALFSRSEEAVLRGKPTTPRTPTFLWRVKPCLGVHIAQKPKVAFNLNSCREMVGGQRLFEIDVKPNIEVSDAEGIFCSSYATRIITSRQSSSVALFQRLSCGGVLGRYRSRDGPSPARRRT